MLCHFVFFAVAVAWRKPATIICFFSFWLYFYLVFPTVLMLSILYSLEFLCIFFVIAFEIFPVQYMYAVHCFKWDFLWWLFFSIFFLCVLVGCHPFFIRLHAHFLAHFIQIEVNKPNISLILFHNFLPFSLSISLFRSTHKASFVYISWYCRCCSCFYICVLFILHDKKDYYCSASLQQTACLS